MNQLRAIYLPLFVLTLLRPLNLRAQDEKEQMDSLRARYIDAETDSLRAEILLQQARILTYTDPDSAGKMIGRAAGLMERSEYQDLFIRCLESAGAMYFKLARYNESIEKYAEALEIAQASGNLPARSVCYNWLGNAYQRKGDYVLAEEYHLKNLELGQSVNDREGIASTYNNLGNNSNEKGDYTRAVEYYTLALRKYEELNDELSSAIVLANIGMINNQLEKYDEAIRNLNQSNTIFRKLNHQPGINFVLRTLGVSYKNKGDLEKAMATYREALINYSAINARFELSQVLQNIGNVFFEWGKYDSAMTHYMNSLKYSLEIEDSTGIGRTYNSIAAGYYAAGDPVPAKEYLLKALAVGQKIGNAVITMNAWNQLAQVYAHAKEYDKAFSSLQHYGAIRDSLHNVEKLKIAEEIEAKYQNEKKQEEISLLSSKNQLSALQIRKRRTERNYLLILTIATLLIGFVIFRQYKIKMAANKNLLELNRLQSGFFANISHEFRTPLTLILTSLEKLKAGRSNQDENYGLIEKYSTRLLRLINQLLDLSKLEAGSEKLYVSTINVPVFMQTLGANFMSLADTRHIRYSVEVSPDELKGQVDPDKMEKIVSNLLSNAFKFTPSGGHVSFSCRCTDREMTVSVEDTGKGIPQEAIDKIFNRFYQVDMSDNRDFEGTGIGLALIKELVQLHHGTIRVTSKLNNGTRFEMTIPLHGYRPEQTGSADQSPEPSQLLPEVTAAAKQLHQNQNGQPGAEFLVLIVEDNVDLLAHLSNSLAGYSRVITAVDGAVGFEAALENIPDLIISDVMMPEMDGIELCHRLKTHEKTSHIPVILLTARADRESRLEGLKTGADDYLAKPFDTLELKIRIDNQLQQRKRVQDYVKNRLFFPGPHLNANEKFIKKATDTILANLTDSGFNSESFTRLMGYSRMQLYRKIRAITGKSTGEFILSVRLKNAAMLLKKDFDNIAQIAYATGFSSPSHFSKCFKEQYGVSPKDYVRVKSHQTG